VLARAEQVRVMSWDAVLARWARTGVAAALVVALAAAISWSRDGAAHHRSSDRAGRLDRAARHPGEVEVVLASVIENN